MSLQEIQKVEILSFIAHIVDHNADEPQLIDLDTPLTDDFPHKLFEDYILLALQDENRRLARFRGKDGEGVSRFRSVGGSTADFVDASQSIAKQLHAAMKRSKKADWITPGDLMVARFRDRTKNPDTVYLALLKVDLSNAVIREVEEVGTKRRVVFRKRQAVPLPTEGKLHKIALIAARRETEPEPHDLVILDNDLRREEVSRYFYDDFLHADLNRSASEITRILTRSMLVRPTVVKPPLQPGERLQIAGAVEEALNESLRISPAALAERATRGVEPPERRQIVLDTLVSDWTTRAKVGADEDVKVDAGEVRKATEKLTYLLDFQVRITGKAADVRKLVEIDPQCDAAGRTVLRIASRRFDTE